MRTPTTAGPDAREADLLRHAIGTAERTSSPALKLAVLSYVDEVKSLGWPIERIIVRIKAISTEESAPGDVRRSTAPNARSQYSRVIDQAISWAIAHYYGEKAR